MKSTLITLALAAAGAVALVCAFRRMDDLECSYNRREVRAEDYYTNLGDRIDEDRKRIAALERKKKARKR